MYNIRYHIKNFKSTLILLCINALCLFATQAMAQSVNITVNITPPYSPYYSDYSNINASKVLLTVQNLTNTTKNIKLTGQLEGDNGIRITTKSNYVPLQPIVLAPNQVKQLNGLALKDIFDVNTLNVYGVDKVKIVQTSRLPEGNYTFCVQAVDISNNQVLSATAPLGCTTINIAYPDAPVLIGPMANATVTATQPQAMVFNWINAGFAPVGTQYVLQVAEMPLTNANPNQVLNSTSFPLVNKTLMATSYVLSPADPSLKVGKRYAWRVKAIDPTGRTVFKNNGISGAQQFRYGDEIKIASVLTLDSPENNRKIENINKLIFAWRFTNNSAQNDQVSLSGLTSISNNLRLSTTTATYRLYINRVKTEVEKAQIRTAAIKAVNAQVVANDGIVVDVNDKQIVAKNSQAIAAYLKDGNNYTWYVEHVATGTKSAGQNFTYQSPKQKVDYTIQLAGRLKYRYYIDYLSFKSKNEQKNMFGGNKTNVGQIKTASGKDISFTEAETGYVLANMPIQVLRVKLLVPVLKTTRKVTINENGVEKTYQKQIDSIPTLTDIGENYAQQIKIASVIAVATGKTDAMGNFNLTVPIAKNNFNVIDSNVVLYPSQTKKALVEGIVVQVNDQRFSDPNWFVFLSENRKDVALPENVVQIYDYKLDVNFTTQAQRNYQGKLYVLKTEQNLVKGEVDNLVGQTKDMLTISKSLYAFPGISSYNYSHATLSTVGVKDVNGLVNPNSSLSFSFNKLASGKGNYTVYFEPSQDFDGLYFGPATIANNNLKTVGFESTVFQPKNITEKVVLGPKYLKMNITGRYVYKWKSDANNTKLPLPEGTKLTLVKGYLTTKSLIKDLGTDLLEQNKVATTTVGKNGEFKFDLGLLNYASFNNDAGKQMVILVDDDYYASEPTMITYNENENIKLPELTAVVRQMKFTSKLMYKKGEEFKPANQMQIYLCRLKGVKPATIPTNEGDPNNKDYFKRVYTNIDGKQYDIIDKTVPADDGTFSFNRVVLPSKDLKDAYFILAEPQSTSSDNYLTEEAFPLTGVIRFWSIFTLGSLGQQTFTDATQILDYKYTANNQYVLVVPQNPFIDGAVYPYSNTATSVLSGVRVELFDMVNTQIPATSTYEQFEKYFADKTPVEVQITGTNGRFSFSEFYNNFLSRMRGKLLRLSKAGFITTYKPIQGGITLVKGQRANLDKVYLDLPIDVNAMVVDESGKAVSARIVVGDDFSWADTFPLLNGQFANLKSPRGKVKFTIIPTDKAKYQTTTVENTIDPAKTTGITLTVKSNSHKLIVTVIDKTTQKSVPASIYVTNISTTPTVDKFSANGTYINTVQFASGGSRFDIKAIPTGNLTVGKMQVISDMTKTINVTIYVEPAVSLTCFATTGEGRNKTTLTDYNIVIDGLDEDDYVVTKRTTSEGTLISKIPYNRWLDIGATAKGYIGQTQAVLTNSAKTLNFNFAAADKLTPDNLYGFPVEITSLGKLNDGSYLISGRLNPAGKTGNLTPSKTNNWLHFKDVKVKTTDLNIGNKGGIVLNQKPLVTVLSDVVFDENELDAKFSNKIDVIIKDAAGLRLQSENGSTGSLMGRLALDAASLSAGVSTNVSASNGDAGYLYLNKMETGYVGNEFSLATPKPDYLKTLTTATSDVLATMKLSTLSRKRPVFYIVDGFTVNTEDNVTLTNTGISAKANIKPTLAYVASNNTLLKGTFNIGTDNFSFTQQEALNLKLNQWQLEFSSWTLTKEGFMGAGNLNALGLSIPFTKLKMTATKLGFGNFNVKQLTLLNKFPVKLNANEVMTSFGFDKGYSKEKGAWSVAILANSQNESLAALSGLPDLDPNDKIYINNINLYDTGDPNDTRILLTENQPAVTLNGISSYRPYSVFGGLDFISFRGSLDMNVPNLTGLGNVTYDLKYKVVNNNFVHVHETPFKNLALDVNGIKVKFSENDQQFSNGVLKLTGNLEDKDPSSAYKILVQLDKTPKATRLHIPENTPTPQKVYLSGDTKSTNYLDNAVGEMKVTDNVWSNFSFSGDLAGADGLNAKDSRVTFTIKGDIVASNSKIGVQNMDAGGMKGISFAYDFKEKALVGSASFSQNTDFADLTMDIDMKIGSANWYIFSNCVAKEIKNTPFSQASAGLMLGNATLNGAQMASLHKHFKDNDIPDNFDANYSSVKGILMVMSAELPIPIIPTFDLNLDPVAHASLTHGIYGNLYYNAGFSLKKEDLSFAMGARLGAFVKLSVGASIGLACVGINLHADAHADVSGKLAPFAPAGQRLQLDAGVKFTLQGSAYVGAGVCDSNCETPCVDAGFFDICSPIPCVKKGLSKTLVLGLSAEVTDAKPYFHFKGLTEL